jgi:hypothetical protein
VTLGAVADDSNAFGFDQRRIGVAFVEHAHEYFLRSACVLCPRATLRQ